MQLQPTILAGSSLAAGLSPTSPTLKVPPTSPPASSGPGPSLSPTKIIKAIQKVSFKDRIKSLQGQSDTSKMHQGSKSISSDNSDMKQHLIPPPSPTHSQLQGQIRSQVISSSSTTTSSSNNNNNSKTNNNSKPSTAQTIKEKIKSFSHFDKIHRVDHASSMSSVHTISATTSTTSIKPWSKLKLATVIGGSYTSLNNAQADDSPKIKRGGKATSKQSKATTGGSDLNLVSRHTEKSLSIQNEKASVSDSEIKNLPRVVPKIKQKPKPIKIDPHPKNYQSVDDLSPEYGGLPFVKKLKILNERQKLAELESVIQTRSFSLDCTDSNNYAQVAMEPLYRSHSEASCMVPRMTNTEIPHNTTPIAGGDRGYLPVDVPQQCLNSPLSPESNETRERRELKSILKKLSEDKMQVGEEESKDLHRLMRAQTLEGYVARHSKFTKSVTFNRNTLSSPPNSAGLPPQLPPSSVTAQITQLQHQMTPPTDGSMFPMISDMTSQEQILSPTSEITKISSKQIITEQEYHHTVQSKITDDSPPKLPFFTAMSPNQRNIIKGTSPFYLSLYNRKTFQYTAKYNSSAPVYTYLLKNTRNAI